MRTPKLPFMPTLVLLASLLHTIYASSGGGGKTSTSNDSGSGSGAPSTSNIEAEYRGLAPSCQAELKKLMTSSSTIGSCTGIGVGCVANGLPVLLTLSLPATRNRRYCGWRCRQPIGHQTYLDLAVSCMWDIWCVSSKLRIIDN